MPKKTKNKTFAIFKTSKIAIIGMRENKFMKKEKKQIAIYQTPSGAVEERLDKTKNFLTPKPK